MNLQIGQCFKFGEVKEAGLLMNIFGTGLLGYQIPYEEYNPKLILACWRIPAEQEFEVTEAYMALGGWAVVARSTDDNWTEIHFRQCPDVIPSFAQNWGWIKENKEFIEVQQID